MKSIAMPYKSEIIAVIIVAIFFVLVKNRFQYVKVQTDAVEAGKAEVEQHKALASRWISVDKDSKEAAQGFMLKGPMDLKGMVQDKAWSNDINLVDMRANQDLSGVVGVGTLDLVISGSFRSIVKFIEAIEASNIRVTSFSVSGSDKKKNVNIKVYCYFPKDADNG